MVETGDQKPPPATKPCRICAEEIKLAASKCTHCSSFQDWRGGFGSVSATLLSLLVALVSVVTAGVPIIKAALTPANSDLRFSVQDLGLKEVALLVSNAGARPGTVRFGMIAFDDPGSRSRYFLTSQGTSGAVQSVLIEAGTAKLITFRRGGVFAPRSDTELDEPPPTARRCWLELQFTNFDGTERSQSAELDCNRTAGLMPEEYVRRLDLNPK